MAVFVPGIGEISEERWKQGFMLFLENDTEDSPWMVMGSLQWDATCELYASLRAYAERSQPTWFVAGMLPIRFTWPDVEEKKQLAPDLFVALAPDHPRPSFDVDDEGARPAFVLEVVSPWSSGRDHVTKKTAYEMLEVREYALFTPATDRASTLEGFQRNAQGKFEPWLPDAQGRLWSDVLGLYLVVQDATIRAATFDGQLLLTLREAIDLAERESATLQREAELRAEEAARRAQEAAARQEAEAEVERLRREVEELRHRAGS